MRAEVKEVDKEEGRNGETLEAEIIGLNMEGVMC